jgi:flagellar biosynthesis/type III secretory pathway protein FliH
LDEGEKLGIKQGRKLGIEEWRKFGIEEDIEKGMNLGCEEGYLVTKEGFERAIKAKEALGKTNNTINIDCSPQTNTNTCKMAMQVNNSIEWQSMSTQTTTNSTADTIVQTAPNNELPHH